ncbi:MAG: REP-associated tyrosine transposase [Syntrophomonadaceae bacterium]|nr:helix-turn-helix domain-containing protein [Syntrophomonadaceae bacterium]
MPRNARQKALYSTYHIIQRGNDQREIFKSDQDRVYFIELLRKSKQEYKFLLYAYCLMNNHVHLALYDNGTDISQIMRSINVSYASYFNRKYQRSGHLFQDRFKSELVEDDRYVMELSRYIHNNPVKAGLVKNPEEYKWSSFRQYMSRKKDIRKLIDSEFILALFSDDLDRARIEYNKFVKRTDNVQHNFLDIDDDPNKSVQNHAPHIFTVAQGHELLVKMATADKMNLDQYLKNRQRRDIAIRELRKHSTLSLKEIAEVCGSISESTVSRILRG